MLIKIVRYSRIILEPQRYAVPALKKDAMSFTFSSSSSGGSKTEDPNLIATLVSEGDHAVEAFKQQVNEARSLPPSRTLFEEHHTLFSRASTPSSLESINKDADLDLKHRLLLSFDPPPKDPSKGYAFGTDQDQCDVWLGSVVTGISRVHFYVTFEEIGGKRRLVLKDCSRYGTAVRYGGQANDEKRSNFTWILDLDRNNEGEEALVTAGEKKEEWEVQVNARSFSFILKLASHQTCNAEYEDRVTNFLSLTTQTNQPLMGGLNAGINTVKQRSQSRPLGHGPIHLNMKRLGKGGYGVVDKIVDVSTSAVFARKTLLEPKYIKDVALRVQKLAELEQLFAREIRLLRENPHEYIIPIENLLGDHHRSFLMPYMPLGTLRSQHHQNPLSQGELVDLVFQGLTVLDYLHLNGVVYRDIKPDNTLVKQRAPLVLQFADFGVASDDPLNTVIGTPRYAAPEIFQPDPKYTDAIDIWSMGVVIFECAYHLPKSVPQPQHMGKNQEQQSREWSSFLIISHRQWRADPSHARPLIDGYIERMMQLDPADRSSARALLDEGRKTGLFGTSTGGSAHAVPAQSRTLTAVVNNGEEATTIRLDGPQAPSHPEEVEEAMDDTPEFVHVTIDRQKIHMRRIDRLINAVQMLKVPRWTPKRRITAIKGLKGRGLEVQILPAQGDVGNKNTWIGLNDAKLISTELRIMDKLQPLWDLAESLDKADGGSFNAEVSGGDGGDSGDDDNPPDGADNAERQLPPQDESIDKVWGVYNRGSDEDDDDSSDEDYEMTDADDEMTNNDDKTTDDDDITDVDEEMTDVADLQDSYNLDATVHPQLPPRISHHSERSPELQEVNVDPRPAPANSSRYGGMTNVTQLPFLKDLDRENPENG